MNRSTMTYVNPGVKFKRMEDDGLIHAVCDKVVDEGDVVCYEIPVKSTGKSFKVDTLRYTMQCVYGGECLFPCAFNQEAPSEEVKVFFDYAFRTRHRREVSEKLALALYTHNKTNTPFLFKTLGVFQQKLVQKPTTCVRVSYDNGETFLVASRRLAKGEILNTSQFSVKIPTLKQESDFATTMKFVSGVDVAGMANFTKALSYRDKAALVRPKGGVVHVSHTFDPNLEKRLAKYCIDRDMGISDFYVNLDRLREKADKDSNTDQLKTDLADMDEMYDKFYESFLNNNNPNL